MDGEDDGGAGRNDRRDRSLRSLAWVLYRLEERLSSCTWTADG